MTALILCYFLTQLRCLDQFSLLKSAHTFMHLLWGLALIYYCFLYWFCFILYVGFLLLQSSIQSSKMESVEDSPVTPPLTRERLPRNLYRPPGMGMGYSSSDSLDHHPMQSRQYCDSGGMNSTPKLSSISGTKTETSSMDASIRSSSSRDADRSGELSISNASDLETEWVEQDEPGVYITIRALPGGKRELRRVRFR